MKNRHQITKLIAEAIEDCKKILSNLHTEHWSGPSASWYDPPDEPDIPEQCPSCEGELDYDKEYYPCKGKPCGWQSTHENDLNNLEHCPECEGEITVEELADGQHAVVCQGKGCGWDTEPNFDPPDFDFD